MNINEIGPKINRVHVLTMGNQPTKYEVNPRWPSQDNVVTSIYSAKTVLAPPLMNINEVQNYADIHMYSTIHQSYQNKFEQNQSYGCRDIDVLSFSL